jgi:ATP-binding cassette, subfamily B, bacterial CvaB/MchF/RaxB
MGVPIQFMRWRRRGNRKTVPVILQSEATECGLACLAMILSSLSRPYDVRSLRESFSTSSGGVSLRRLIDIAHHVGLAARALRVEIEYTPQLQLPCLLHWGLLHYVVLVAITRNRYVIHDPALGRRVIGRDEFSRLFTGIAVEFSFLETPQQPGVSKRLTWRAVFEKARSGRVEIAALLSLATVCELLQIVAPCYLQWTIDWVIGPADASMRNVLAAVFAGVLVAQAGMTVLRSLALVALGARVHRAWLTDVFAHAVRLPLSFFARRYLSDIAGRFEGISAIQRCITSGFLEMLLDGFMAIGLLAVMCALSVRLAAASCCAIACAVLVRTALLERLRDSIRSYEMLHSSQQGYFLETLQSLQAIKIFATEGMRVARWSNLAARSQNYYVRAERIQTLFRISNLLIFGVERVFVVWFASQLAMLHSMSVGMLVSYVMYRELLVARVTVLLDKYIEAKSVEVHLDRLSDIALAEPEPQQGTADMLVNEGPPRIEFTGLWFRYSDDEPWILQDLSGEVPVGKTIAFTGPSGCGKSTLLKILQGLLKPTRGSVKVNGVPVMDALQSYRRLIASVNQGDELLMGTIAENIAFFDAPLDFDRVQWAARLAHVETDVQNMPMGYHTLITDGGASLSGGQRQRLILARALYKKPQILFLDEATSHLDVATEAAILREIKQLPMTRVMVAHRPETVAACDDALQLEDGTLKLAAESGNCPDGSEAKQYANA